MLPRRGDGGRGRGRAAVLRNSIFFQLRDDILKGRFEPGESLVELKLAAHYGVSRTPLGSVKAIGAGRVGKISAESRRAGRGNNGRRCGGYLCYS